MNKQIKLTYGGIDYILEFDRMSIKMLEAAGFNYNEFLDKPMTNIELAFTGAFLKNHPKTKQTTIDEIYANLKNRTDLIAAISSMINDCYDSLLLDPEETEGNVTWEVVDLTPKKKEKSQG